MPTNEQNILSVLVGSASYQPQLVTLTNDQLRDQFARYAKRPDGNISYFIALMSEASRRFFATFPQDEEVPSDAQ